MFYVEGNNMLIYIHLKYIICIKVYVMNMMQKYVNC